jgi:hypothetical protein
MLYVFQTCKSIFEMSQDNIEEPKDCQSSLIILFSKDLFMLHFSKKVLQLVNVLGLLIKHRLYNPNPSNLRFL